MAEPSGKTSESKAGSEPQPDAAAPESQKARPVTSRATTRLPQSEIESLRKHSVDQAARFKAMLRAENA